MTKVQIAARVAAGLPSRITATERAAQKAAYARTDAGKAAMARAHAAYMATDAGKAQKAAYARTDAGKAAQAKGHANWNARNPDWAARHFADHREEIVYSRLKRRLRVRIESKSQRLAVLEADLERLITHAPKD